MLDTHFGFVVPTYDDPSVFPLFVTYNLTYVELHFTRSWHAGFWRCCNNINNDNNNHNNNKKDNYINKVREMTTNGIIIKKKELSYFDSIR